MTAISPRCFYARGGRWSFHTAWAKTGKAHSEHFSTLYGRASSSSKVTTYVLDVVEAPVLTEEGFKTVVETLQLPLEYIGEK
jgi:hypothetical protein